MLLSLTLMVVLQAPPVDADERSASETNSMLQPGPDEVPDFVREPAERGARLDAQRVKRFVGALVGGALALAIPIAVNTPNCDTNLVCGSAFQNLTLGLMPLVAGLGAYFGHHLMGGEAEYPFATLGAGVGSLLGMIVLAFANGLGLPPTSLFPFVAAAGGITAFAMAFLLDVRDQAIRPLGAAGHATGARLWASFGATIGVAVVGAFAAVLFSGLNDSAGLGVGGVALAALPLVAWVVHKSLGGAGSLLASYLGLLVGAAAVLAVAIPTQALIGTGTSVFYPTQNAALATGSAFLAVLLGPLVGLELSHTGVKGEGLSPPMVTLVPIQGGAMLGGGVRF